LLSVAWEFLGLLLNPLGTIFCRGIYGRKVKRKKTMVIHHIIFTAYGEQEKNSYRVSDISAELENNSCIIKTLYFRTMGTSVLYFFDRAKYADRLYF